MEKVEKNGKFDIRTELYDWATGLQSAMIFVVALFALAMCLFSVSGTSMLSTLYDGDRVFISNLFYTPERGDIVMFNTPEFNLAPEKIDKKGMFSDSPLVKRVIAVGGDTLEIRDNKVFINSEPEKYASEDLTKYLTGLTTAPEVGHPQITRQQAKTIPNGGLLIPEGYVFCMGDNRTNSTDCRSFGMIDERYILGRVLFRVYPLDRFGKVE